MRFSGGGEELFDGIFIDVKRGSEYFGLGLEYICVEVECAEEPFEDCRENSVEGFVFEGSEGGEGKMAQNTGGYEGAASSGRTHCCH